MVGGRASPVCRGWRAVARTCVASGGGARPAIRSVGPAGSVARRLLDLLDTPGEGRTEFLRGLEALVRIFDQSPQDGLIQACRQIRVYLDGRYGFPLHLRPHDREGVVLVK